MYWLDVKEAGKHTVRLPRLKRRAAPSRYPYLPRARPLGVRPARRAALQADGVLSWRDHVCIK